MPLAKLADVPAHLGILEEWLKSYQPWELFDQNGRLRPDLKDLAAKGERRMGANPNANGGLLLKDLNLPDFCRYAVEIDIPGTQTAESTRVAGQYLRDVLKLNAEDRNFRIFGPDETESNRLSPVF